MEMEIYDMNLLNWVEKYAGDCNYFKIVLKWLRYDNIKIKDILFDMMLHFTKQVQLVLKLRATRTEESLKKIMESNKIEEIIKLEKPLVDELSLEIIGNMIIFKEYSIYNNSWANNGIDILNKIKDNHEKDEWINEIMKEVVKIEDNIDIINDYCYRYEKFLKIFKMKCLKKKKKVLIR